MTTTLICAALASYLIAFVALIVSISARRLITLHTAHKTHVQFFFASAMWLIILGAWSILP